MADIFISYSSKDREKADQLAELLTSAGLSVWIDRLGIDVATSWSGEIVQAIDTCKAFVVLLSPFSVESKNVTREVALAFEKNKKILPLDLEPVALSNDLQYHLAGIQRSPMTNIDAIIRSLGKLGLEATQAPSLRLIKETDSRKSLMILPFQDLSPTGDNAWFADGIVSELISALSNVKALSVTDAQTTKDFKRYQGTLPNYAKEMRIRYFVEGDVRKFGDNIKITSRLLDIETGDHLWQDSMKGMMDDIFDIQETVAKKVVEGLQIILTKDEEQQVLKKPTENAEAYELWLKGQEYHSRITKSDFERALALYEEAVRLDPSFATAYASIVRACIGIYSNYHGKGLLERAAEAAEQIKVLEGETAQYFCARSTISIYASDVEEALAFAKRAVALDPDYPTGYSALSWAYDLLDRQEEAAVAKEKVLQFQPTSLSAYFSYLLTLHDLGDDERINEVGERAIVIYERHIRLNPDDYHARVVYSTILSKLGKTDAAIRVADELSAIPSLDSNCHYNLACSYLVCDRPEKGLSHLRWAVTTGYRDLAQFLRDNDLNPIRHLPEFQQLVQELEAIVEEEKNG